jgi:sugar phosphate isomerase/epimerase
MVFVVFLVVQIGLLYVIYYWLNFIGYVVDRREKEFMPEALETLNNVTPSETAIAMEAMATIHVVALDAFHYFYSQETTLILIGARRHHHHHHSLSERSSS